MRTMACLVLLGSLGGTAAAQAVPLTFDDIVRRALADPARLDRVAELSRFERSVSATGRFTREGAVLEADLGPRRVESGAVKADGTARVAFPLLADHRLRDEAGTRLRDTGPELLAADAIEARLRLRAAYLDAWFEEERLAVIDEQADALERVASSVRQRVEAGAEAPYEVALAEGELLRLRADADAARAARGNAWSGLRTLADVPADPQPLASPGQPRLEIPDDAQARFDAGVLRRAVAQGRALDAAFVAFDQAQRRSRWSIGGAVGREGDETFATVGAAYRFPLRGESRAATQERAAATAALDRASEAGAARLETRFRTALDRVRRFGSIQSPGSFDDALRAVALRVELGKERPSQALPVRRQILDARLAALQRVRDAHHLLAELDALTAGDAP